jgi:hypothetical protein
MIITEYYDVMKEYYNFIKTETFNVWDFIKFIYMYLDKTEFMI